VSWAFLFPAGEFIRESFRSSQSFKPDIAKADGLRLLASLRRNAFLSPVLVPTHTQGRSNMVKSLTLAAILVAATSLSAGAQNRTTVEERPAITVPLPVPGIEVERRDRVERREVETTGRGGCDSKTVRKEGPEGSKTVTKERCD
jgi:hypothetical protein